MDPPVDGRAGVYSKRLARVGLIVSRAFAPDLEPEDLEPRSSRASARRDPEQLPVGRVREEIEGAIRPLHDLANAGAEIRE